MLRLVIENLLSNAVKYTRGKPEAVIEVGRLPPQDGEAVFFVRDNGVGFDMAYVDKLSACSSACTASRISRAPASARECAPHRGAPWRPGLGRGQARRGRDLHLHFTASRGGALTWLV